MSRISHQELRSILTRLYNRQTPLFVKGTIGIGKSWSIKDHAKDMAKLEKREFVEWNDLTPSEKKKVANDPSKHFIFGDIRLSQVDPSDLRGVPSLVADAVACDWRPPLLFVAMGHREAKGVLFFDEMNLAPPSILASSYQIIHDYQIGEQRINHDIQMIAAGNTSNDQAGIFTMPGPLLNRFAHVELERPKTDDWCDWAVGAGLDSRIISYLRFKPGELFTYDIKNKAEAFATPRTWHRLSEVINGSTSVELDLSMIEHLAAALVGEGPGSGFRAFIQLHKKIVLEDYLRRPEKASEIGASEVGLKWAIITGLAELWARPPTKKSKAASKKKSDDDDDENLYSVDRCFKVAVHFDPEFGVMLTRLMKRIPGKETEFIRQASSSKVFDEFSRKFTDLILQKGV